MGQGKKSSGQAARRGAKQTSRSARLAASGQNSQATVNDCISIIAEMVTYLRRDPRVCWYVGTPGGAISYGIPPWLKSKL